LREWTKSSINCYHSVPQRDTWEAIYVEKNLLQNFIPFPFGKTSFSTIGKRRLMMCKYDKLSMALQDPNK
jgi:hypothetical protein